jgi:thiosulfate dehydrogenase
MVKIARKYVAFIIIAICVVVIAISLFVIQPIASTSPLNTKNKDTAVTTSRLIRADAWKAPDISTIPAGKAGEMIHYGRELLTHTGNYFGPNGSIAHLTNGMNCQNCHLDGGSKLFANNYASFIATYPKMIDRSGKLSPLHHVLPNVLNVAWPAKYPIQPKKKYRQCWHT